MNDDANRKENTGYCAGDAAPSTDTFATLITENKALKRENLEYIQRDEKQMQDIMRLQRELNHVTQLHSSVVESAAWKATWPFRAAASFVKTRFSSSGKKAARPKMPGATAGEYVGSRTQNLWLYDLPVDVGEPLVSVIVPNYNHAAFLRRRLDSIYSQSYANTEVILLDDASTDDSRAILQEYAARYPDKTRTVFNDKNGGSVAEQWQKGLALATGEYVWIAESDDSCQLNFLEELVPLLRRQSVTLAFAKSLFVQNGTEVWSIEQYLKDLPAFDWEHPFVVTGHTAANSGFARKNLIPNVSSALFRHPGQLPMELTGLWDQVKLTHDWLLYLWLLRGGALAYTNKTLNYYEIHQNSTSLAVQKTPGYYREQCLVSQYAAGHYKLPTGIWDDVLADLKEHYKSLQQTEDAGVVGEYYDVAAIRKVAENRSQNVAMCTFSMQVGGGEIVPLHLANEMRRQGVSVTLFNYNMEDYRESVRKMLHPAVPLVNLAQQDITGEVFPLFGIDISHSHHLYVDLQTTEPIMQSEKAPYKSVISLHGMYEAIDSLRAEDAIHRSHQACSKYFYLTEQNIRLFKACGVYTPHKFIKMPNGMPRQHIETITRESLGIPEDAFVLVTASRAIPEKGWAEAVQAVQQATQKSSRPIHLLLLGSGEMADTLKESAPANIHLLGEKQNVQDYIDIADMGFLPSRFKGESFPLFVIECLLCEKPVLASDVGVVREMLTTDDGQVAGCLFELGDWQVPVDVVAGMISFVANDASRYSEMQNAIHKISGRYAIEKVVQQQLCVYQQMLR